MRALWIGITLIGLVRPAVGQDPGDAPPPAVDPPGIRATQLSASCDRDGDEVRFRATVLGKREGLLTILTAAHCLGPDDAGRAIRLAQPGGTTIDGKLLAVRRNPSYGKFGPGAIPGADNSLAWVRVPADAALVDRLEAAVLAPDPPPEAEALPIYCIDQFEKAHGVKAGNFANPKWLQWGPDYRPIPGDSGSGVFAYRPRPDGTPEPLLIGVVTDRDRSGGGASVVCRRHPWIAQALDAEARANAKVTSPAVSPNEMP
jgi:hypothetical protein